MQCCADPVAHSRKHDLARVYTLASQNVWEASAPPPAGWSSTHVLRVASVLRVSTTNESFDAIDGRDVEWRGTFFARLLIGTAHEGEDADVHEGEDVVHR